MTAFLELSVCSLISLSASNFSSSNALIQWLGALCFLLASGSIVAFLLAKFCRGGPYLKKYYKPLTLHSLCCWSLRPLNPSYDYTAWLKKCRARRFSENRELDELKFLGIFRQPLQKKPQHQIKIKGN